MLTMKKTIIILSVTILILSCKTDGNEEINIAKTQVIENNDLESYMALTNYFDTDKNYFEIIPYSLKMQKAGIGHYDFFKTYLKIAFDNEFESENIIRLEKPERDFLIHILFKGAKTDDPSCKEVLIEYYRNGWGVSKNLNTADSIYKTFEYPELKR